MLYLVHASRVWPGREAVLRTAHDNSISSLIKLALLVVLELFRIK